MAQCRDAGWQMSNRDAWQGAHAFVVMPFGIKEGIDFNAVYDDLVFPAIEQAGLEPFRADKEQRAGDIRTDMFQELLLADLVVADLSIDNPNAWYELGVRHALRSRGIVQIQSARDYMPFDVAVDRALSYSTKDGVPDPDTLDADRNALAAMISETMGAWHNRKVSPVYSLLPDLDEPSWERLRVSGSSEFWDLQTAWKRRLEVARRQNKPGDVLVLADEAPTWVTRLDARRAAGDALQALGQYDLALEQYDLALAISPTNKQTRSQKGVVLGRLGRRAEAQEWADMLLKDYPDDAEIWSRRGRVDKDSWLDGWIHIDESATERREAALDGVGDLDEAISSYTTAYVRDPSHYYSGINALTLRQLLEHLEPGSVDEDEMTLIEGGVRWDIEAAIRKDPRGYFAKASFAELTIHGGDLKAVRAAFRQAIAADDADWFSFDSTQQTLKAFQLLDYQTECVDVALGVLGRAIATVTGPEVPRMVVLFSGHMVDAPDRSTPRFPAAQVPVAAEAINAKLGELGVGEDDLGICGGASGGDILFAEACLARGARVELRLSFEEPEFIRRSVQPAGDEWRDRYYALAGNERVSMLIMPDELGEPPKGVDSFERTNIWHLYTAVAYGVERLRFVALWDGAPGDGFGGTEDMVRRVEGYSGQVHRILTTDLW